MQDVTERDEEKALLRQYTRPSQNPNRSSQPQTDVGFVVRDAPWNSAEDFPSLGTKGGGGSLPSRKAQWGPSSRGPKIPRK